MSKENIQFAKPEDINQIVSFGFYSFRENLLEGLPCKPDLNKGLAVFTDAVLNEGIVLVKRNTSNPKLLEGTLAMKLDKPWFSDDACLYVLLYFIKPEFRSFKLAKDLLNAAKEYAIINNLPIVFDLFAQKDAKKKIKLLKYMGFKEYGTVFIFTPPE